MMMEWRGSRVSQLFPSKGESVPRRYITFGLGSCGARNPTNFESDKTRQTRQVPTSNIYGSDMTSVANMDVQMTDQPQEALALLEEDRLRQIARHVKDYIPGNGDGNIDEQKL